MCKGALPLLSLMLILAPCAIKNRTISRFARYTAWYKGVIFNGSRRLISTPNCTSILTISRLLLYTGRLITKGSCSMSFVITSLPNSASDRIAFTSFFNTVSNNCLPISLSASIFSCCMQIIVETMPTSDR